MFRAPYRSQSFAEEDSLRSSVAPNIVSLAELLFCFKVVLQLNIRCQLLNDLCGYVFFTGLYVYVDMVNSSTSLFFVFTQLPLHHFLTLHRRSIKIKRSHPLRCCHRGKSCIRGITRRIECVLGGCFATNAYKNLMQNVFQCDTSLLMTTRTTSRTQVCIAVVVHIVGHRMEFTN